MKPLKSLFSFSFSFLFLLISFSLFSQHKIPFTALVADGEGIFGVGKGNRLPDELCAAVGVDTPYYANLYISSADQQNTYPNYASGGHLRDDILGGITGFPLFTAAITNNGLDLNKVHIRFAEMTLDVNNWQFIQGVDTRMYTGGQFSLVYIDGGNVEVIVDGSTPRLRDVINFNDFDDCFDDEIYGDTEYFIPTYAAENSPVAIQNLANALIADISVEGVKIQFYSIQTAIQGFWSVGHIFQVNSGVIIKGKAPMMDLDFNLELAALGNSNQCTNTLSVTSTGSGDWLHLRQAGNLVASVLDSEPMGEITASFYKNSGNIRESGNGIEYLDRNIEITPTSQPSMGTIRVRLYFSSTEWDALISANDSDENDPLTFDKLTLSKYSSACSSSSGANGLLVSIEDWGKIGNPVVGGYYLEVSVSSFSTFFFHGPSVEALPIELTSFSVKYIPHTMQLDWETASEINNKGFEIQRSTDGITFNKIKWLDAQAGNRQTKSYSFVDENINYNTNYYYRLKQMDFNGVSSFSSVQIVYTPNTKENTFQCFPNPAKEEVNIIFDKKPIDNPTLYFYNQFGELVQEQTLSEASSKINISHLQAGLYFIALYDTQQQLLGYSKLVKD